MISDKKLNYLIMPRPFFICIHLGMQIEDPPFIRAEFDTFNDSFEELTVFELKVLYTRNV